MSDEGTAIPFVDRYFRIDARSLGLFRVLFGTVLIADLIHRWDWIRAFYSNEGVLPNHFHLFQLGEKEKVWSLYHAFSSVDEATTAFLLTFIIYLCFTLGYRTRVFHLLSLVCLVSLTGRNILLESASSSLATVLLGMSLLLPLGLRFSLDSLGLSMANRQERSAAALNDRSAAAVTAPRSLVAFLMLALVGFVLAVAALSQSGPSWQDGSALYYALHTDRWTGFLGELERNSMPAGALAVCTRAFRYAEFAVPCLLLLPVARRLSRGLAVAAMLFIGLTVGLLFTFGAYGWAIAAAAALAIPTESWNGSRDGKRPIQLVYDDSCGICGWLARLLKRLDRRHNITFFASSDVQELPDGVTEKMTTESMVVVDAKGGVYTEALALSQILRSLPCVAPLGWLLRLPLIRQASRALYFKVAGNRMEISVACGFGACGLPQRHNQADEEEVSTPKPTPASRWSARAKALVATVLALLLLGGVVVKTARHRDNPRLAALAGTTAAANALATIVTIPRVTGSWGLFAPEPPRKNSSIVVDAKTRDGWQLDPLTGHPPNLDLSVPARARLGHLWSVYSEAIRLPRHKKLRKELRRYLNRGGYALNAKPTKDRKKRRYINKLHVQWVSAPIPAPGAAVPAKRQVTTEDILNPRRPASPRRLGPKKLPNLRSLVR